MPLVPFLEGPVRDGAVSLGPRVLRAETAAIAGLALLQARTNLAQAISNFFLADAGLTPVKVNAVLGPGRLGDARPLLRLCLEAGYELRIIEHMPLDADHTWDRSTMITAEQILAELRRVLGEDASNPRWIGTVQGRGYRFVAEVRMGLREPVADRPGEGGALPGDWELRGRAP